MASIVVRADRGGRVYVYWYDRSGRRKGKSFPANERRQAKRFAAEVETQKRDEPVYRMTLETAVVYYLEDRRAVIEARSWERYASVLTNLVETMGGITLAKMDAHALAEWRNDRMTRRARSTVRNDMKAVKAFARWCIKRRWLEDDFSAAVDSPRVKRMVPEHLDPTQLSELIALAKQARPEFYLIAVLAGRAGMRRNEILFLPWRLVDFTNRTITIEGKSKDPRVVPMTTEVEQALLDWPQQGDAVFPACYKCSGNVRSPDLAKRFNDWLKGHGYHITLHGLRHSFAVHLVSRGASERAVGDLLGHQDLQTVRIYARSHLNYLRELMDGPPHAPAEPAQSVPAFGQAASMEKRAVPPAATSPARWRDPKADTTAPD